ncbi:MAG: ATP phosphoribosyltransferase regulatory subunit [Phycisphaerales bacterium]|nr:ATP phosphoribosyltransferase regulatory subunit [Phycisphaerales bacterium]
MASKKINPPKGTRDLYPEDVLRQRYITNAWRDASLRCGFDEIAGPTFESTELYSVKSGEGILGELFQAFSGKGGQETLDKLVKKGQADFALRPEFTPTLARMYAAHAKQLPKPCKWFTAGPYFRAERPQRGRLREFLQWNVDAIGLPSEADSTHSNAQMDAEVIECSVRLFESLGLCKKSLKIMINDRNAMAEFFKTLGVLENQLEIAFTLLDRQAKLPADSLKSLAEDAQLPSSFIEYLTQSGSSSAPNLLTNDLDALIDMCTNCNLDQWMSKDPSIARGLAYYTGTVFEALADGERAVAGGGRYDNLIELFGGPSTPACGFGMGDVVLGNLLDDKGLMPTGAELMDAVASPQASIRPVAFVVPNGDEDNEALVHTLTAHLRRGIESETWLSNDDRKPWHTNRYAVAPMHTRISYKSTRKINKLKADASDQHAKFFIEIHGEDKVELSNMDTRESISSDSHGSFHVDPKAPNYVGHAIAERM